MRLIALAVCALVVLCVAGCGVISQNPGADLARVGPEVQVGSGVGLSGPWAAWLYRTQGGQTCLMVREASGGESGGCNQGDQIAGPMISGDGLNLTTVAGGTSRADAASARVTIVGGRQVMLELTTPAPGVTDGFRYYVGGFPGVWVVDSVELLDTAGNVVESHTNLH
jgi:hypothetical protein